MELSDPLFRGSPLGRWVSYWLRGTKAMERPGGDTGQHVVT